MRLIDVYAGLDEMIINRSREFGRKLNEISKFRRKDHPQYVGL